MVEETDLYPSCSYILSTENKGTINLDITVRLFRKFKEQSLIKLTINSLGEHWLA